MVGKLLFFHWLALVMESSVRVREGEGQSKSKFLVNKEGEGQLIMCHVKC
jgi:hypothetical protein